MTRQTVLVAVLLGNGLGVLAFVLFHPDKALRTAVVMYAAAGGILLLFRYGA